MSTGILKPSRLPAFPLIVAREKLTRPGRARSYGDEERIMEEPQSVREYDACGLTVEVGPHQVCARGISRLIPEAGSLLDLGCGSARLLSRLAHSRPDIRIIGLDLSEPMLETGRRNLAEEGLADRVELRKCDITTFDSEIAEQPDVVSCNFALHHMPEEQLVIDTFKAIARIRERTGCGVWIFDFARLKHSSTFPGFCKMFEWPGPVVRADGIASEKAAFTLEEMRSMIEAGGLGDLVAVRSRPIGEIQVHQAPPRNHPEPVTGLWREAPLPPGTELVERIVRLGFPRSLTQT